MELPERLDRLGRIALLVFVLSAVAFLSAVMAIRFAIQGREVEMPAVVGLKAGDAQAKLAQRGLGFRIADRVYGDLPVDAVARQSPPPGTRVKVPQRAHVVLSLGPRKLPIPLIEGKSLRVARIELLRTGLQVGAVANTHLPETEPDVVVLQSPPPGQMGAGSSRVNLLVSLGEPETFYVMPDFAGVPQSEAQRQIAAAGLKLSRITLIASPGAPKGVVVQQTPPRGTRIPGGASVELQVAE